MLVSWREYSKLWQVYQFRRALHGCMKNKLVANSKHILILRKHISVLCILVRSHLHAFPDLFSFVLIIFYHRQTFGDTSWYKGLGLGQPQLKTICKHFRRPNLKMGSWRGRYNFLASSPRGLSWPDHTTNPPIPCL